jgi:hypothetical protein
MLAYYEICQYPTNYEFVMFYSTDSSGEYNQNFTMLIYNHNDNGHFYKTMIPAIIALARSVNYDHKVRCKLKQTLRSELRTL